MANKPVLAVCTIHNNHRTMGALMDLIQQPLFYGYSLTSGALLPAARNSVISVLLNNVPDFTHLIFIDDDMTDFSGDHVQALIDADKPIISALVTMRMPPYNMVHSFPDMLQDEVIKHIKEESILETDHVGMAFTCIQRHVLDTLEEPTPDGSVWFTMDRKSREHFDLEYHDKFLEWDKQLKTGSIFNQGVLSDAVMFGRTAHFNSNLIGEDISFCDKAKNFGFQSYVHFGVIIGHIGSRPYNVKDTLKYRIEESGILKLEESVYTGKERENI